MSTVRVTTFDLPSNTRDHFAIRLYEVLDGFTINFACYLGMSMLRFWKFRWKLLFVLCYHKRFLCSCVWLLDSVDTDDFFCFKQFFRISESLSCLVLQRIDKNTEKLFSWKSLKDFFKISLERPKFTKNSLKFKNS